MAVKKVPMRSCCGCREKKPKRELIRVVRSPEGEVSFDITGRKAGRGVYLCNDKACLLKAIKSRALARALECEIPEEVYERLEGETEKDE
ncbi:MAG: YlxR family protein [Oscillospiraceae bacterium]|nr:YlxR family protein [Oscillospiraceae bacterium]